MPGYGDWILYKSLLAIVIAMLLFSMSANALFVKAPANIIVMDKQKDIPIAISNEAGEEQTYRISLSAPIEYTLSPISGTLGAGKTTVITLSISPNKGLVGSTYEGTLEVEMGEKKAFKGISVIYKENEPVEDETPKEANATGFFSIGDYSAAIAGLFMPENAINSILAVVAAILLIAFIARFVKRLEASK